MCRVVAFIALFVGLCDAFVPTMSNNAGVSRADFAKVLAAGVAGSAVPAFAAGTSPIQNFFGVIGTGKTVGGGGMSSPYAEIDTYSPYSPYSATEDGTAIYKGYTDEITKRYISTVKDCKTRFEQIPGWAKDAKWMEIQAELTRKAYSLRGAMRGLAKTDKSVDAAKTYFQDMEVMMVESKKKNGAKVLDAYNKSVADLATYLSTL
mmetsp:Transcript_10995/g.16387  ORF Transcript_10995/g.16387 Transcript_10995/m.16387 type:complete len:206 (-) Transcript_10995:86-703(-)